MAVKRNWEASLIWSHPHSHASKILLHLHTRNVTCNHLQFHSRSCFNLHTLL